MKQQKCCCLQETVVKYSSGPIGRSPFEVDQDISTLSFDEHTNKLERQRDWLVAFNDKLNHCQQMLEDKRASIVTPQACFNFNKRKRDLYRAKERFDENLDFLQQALRSLHVEKPEGMPQPNSIGTCARVSLSTYHCLCPEYLLLLLYWRLSIACLNTTVPCILFAAQLWHTHMQGQMPILLMSWRYLVMPLWQTLCWIYSLLT